MKTPKYLHISARGPRFKDGDPVIEVSVKIDWWGWPIMFWHEARRRADYAWWQYPIVVAVILKHWILVLWERRR